MPHEAPSVDVRSAGERIERLLDASAASGPLARERAEKLVRLVVELYGAGLERVLDLAYDAGVLSDDLLTAMADDELVSGLLLVHGLHPFPVEVRVARALDRVRPYMGTHGGDVELIEVTADGVARLRLLGSCDGCASSAVTLDLAVREAVEAAAPEVVRIEVIEEQARTSKAAGLIPIDALTERLHRDAGAGAGQWESIGRLSDLPAGPLWPLAVGGLQLVVCRLGDSLFAYRDCCASCGGGLADASIEKRVGRAGSVVLTCAGCRSHFDVRRAGAGIDDESVHLEPLPLLERDGVIEIAVPSGAAA